MCTLSNELGQPVIKLLGTINYYSTKVGYSGTFNTGHDNIIIGIHYTCIIYQFCQRGR